jgi:CubicO group peptidase (beta-lactamase class C family)
VQQSPSRVWSEVEQLLERAIVDGVTPGAALLVARGTDVEFEAYCGHVGSHGEQSGASVDVDTVYDLASLTKALVTMPAALALSKVGLLDLDRPVVDSMPEFAASPSTGFPGRERIRPRDLLWHCSGLPAHRDWSSCGDAEAVYSAALAEPLIAKPGQRSLYSDVGFLVLGRLLEVTGGLDLEQLLRDRVLRHLNSDIAARSELGFRAVVADSSSLANVAPCGVASSGMLLRGIVNDANARAMGGVAPHAGLFGSARDVHRAALALVQADVDGEWLDSGALSAAWEDQARTAEPSTWVLGWDTPSPEASSAGSLVSAEAVGHLGFTGTSLWLDRQRGAHVVLLTNRVHCGGDATGIRSLRPRIHDAIWKALDSDF